MYSLLHVLDGKYTTTFKSTMISQANLDDLHGPKYSLFTAFYIQEADNNIQAL